MADRLQKILSEHGVCSRREAEKWIEQGRVTVNGIPASLGLTADPEMDLILVDGKPLRSVDEKVVIMLNKPRGYVTTMSDEKGRPTAASLVADCGVRVYPVGRLDMDSEGLLLFTNDGALANYLTTPSIRWTRPTGFGSGSTLRARKKGCCSPWSWTDGSCKRPWCSCCTPREPRRSF